MGYPGLIAQQHEFTAKSIIATSSNFSGCATFAARFAEFDFND